MAYVNLNNGKKLDQILESFELRNLLEYKTMRVKLVCFWIFRTSLSEVFPGSFQEADSVSQSIRISF